MRIFMVGGGVGVGDFKKQEVLIREFLWLDVLEFMIKMEKSLLVLINQKLIFCYFNDRGNVVREIEVCFW